MSSACDRCHRRKSKCDKRIPTCGPCYKAGVECKYVDRTKSRQHDVERLQRRIKQLEATNRHLELRLVAASGQQSSPVSTVGNVDGHDDDRSVEDETTLQDAVPNGPDPPEPGDDEIMEEISFLSSRAGGERNFLGSASGVLLANLVSATVATSRDRNRLKNMSLQDSLLHRRNTAASAVLTGVSPSRSVGSVDVVSLPPERVARELCRAYFENDHLCYPFLHRQTVFSIFERAYGDPKFLLQSPFASYVFDMIVAIATASGPKFDLEALPDAEAYQLRAVQRLNEVLQEGGIQALQALLLLFRYRMINSIQDTSASKCRSVVQPGCWG